MTEPVTTGLPEGLPAGTRLMIGRDVWRYDGGRVLVGGAPTRVVRVSPAAADLVRDGTLEVGDGASARLAETLLQAGIAHPDPDALPPVSLGDLTVVIPVHGRAAALERLVTALHGVAVIVVDDATPEPAASDLRHLAARFGATLLRLERNVGPASARNAGLAQTRTPFVAFVDSDVEVRVIDLERMLRHFADPRLALVGPRVAGMTGRETWIARYENARSSVDLGERPALVRPRSPVSWMSSTCLVARREALGDGFTDGMRVAEDVDLVWRLDERGWRVRYEPRVTVRHEHRRSLGAWLARKAYYGTGAADLAASHPSAIAPAILRPWSAGVVVALLCARRWSVPVAALITAVAAVRLGRRLRDTTTSRPLVLRLIGGGVLSALTQTSALALRHWWPVALGAMLFSRRARWIVAGMAVVDAVVEHRRLHADLDIARFAIARRLDDIAYGAGVWWGCLRRRSPRALVIEVLPRGIRSRRPPAPAPAAGSARTPTAPAPE